MCSERPFSVAVLTPAFFSGTKDREQGIRQAKEAVKIYRDLGDKAMEGAVIDDGAKLNQMCWNAKLKYVCHCFIMVVQGLS